MIIIDYQKKYHTKIIHACVQALRQGKVVAYPTDTSYGLAVDATNIKAIKKLYKIKERPSNKPVHVVVPSISYGRSIVQWNSVASKLAKKFWPGPLTLVLGLRAKGLGFRSLSASSGALGLRFPKNKIALDLARYLKKPITTSSANPSDKFSKGYDSYSVKDITDQFSKKKYQPDIIINAGKLLKRKPSTLVKIYNDQIEILRPGPISEKQIRSLLNTKVAKY